MPKMPRIVGLGLLLLIALNFAHVKSQDDEVDGFNDSYEPFSGAVQHDHDMYGESGDVDIDHRIGGADTREAKADAASDQKPAESLLSMSVDPLSDGMTGEPDIKSVLANAEAQDEINTSATSHRVPHQLNLAVGSSSAYNAPAQQLQYTQQNQQPLQAPPPPPQSTLSEEHRKAITQLAQQQQQTMAQLASEQREAEQRRLEQEAVAVQYQQQQQQQQFVQQYQQPVPVPTVAQVQQQQQFAQQQQQPQFQQAPVAPTVQQYVQPSPTPAGTNQLIQYQQQQLQQPVDPSQQVLQQQQQQYPSSVPQLLTQAVGQQVLQQPLQQAYPGPTQVTPVQYYNPSQAPFLQPQQPQILPGPGPSQAPQAQLGQVHQQYLQGPSQAPPVQLQAHQQYIQGPSQAPPVQQVQQQFLQGPSQAPPVQQVQHQFLQGLGPSQAPPVEFQQQQQLFQSASPSPPQATVATHQQQHPHQQQVFQAQTQPQPQQLPQAPAAQPHIHVVHSPSLSPLSVQHPQQQQQLFATAAGPSQSPPLQQVQQVYQQQQQPIQQHQHQPVVQQYQIPSTVSTAPESQVQTQQFIYQNQQQQQVHVNAHQQLQQQQVFSQFPQHQVQPPQQQPFVPGTPLTIDQYHRQVSPPAQQENALALGSEQSSAVSSPTPQIQQEQQHQTKAQPTPPQNIQQILQQQNQPPTPPPETSDESADYQQEQPPQQQQQQEQQQQQQFQEVPVPSFETSKSPIYPQTYDVQQEYERTINNSGSASAFSQQDLLDANRELNNYAQSIEERAAQILENFRRQVLGVDSEKQQEQETPTQTQDSPATTTTAPVQEVQVQEQLNEAINVQSSSSQYLQSPVQNLVPPLPEVQPTPGQYQSEGQEMQHQQQQKQQQTPDVVQNQEQQQSQEQHDEKVQQAQPVDNELTQEGSASIQNQVVHSQNSLAYPGNQFGGGIQQQQPSLQPPTTSSPMQQTQAVIQQVIETQAIQQNSLQQLWQLYQQQALQQQQLVQQQELQRQTAQVPVVTPQSPYQVLPPFAAAAAPAPVAPVIPKRRVPAPAPLPPNYAQYPVELVPSQPAGQVYYQQFIGPVPTELRRPQPQPQPVHDNEHYTIYKVKDDHDYRALSGALPTDQQIKIETTQPVAPQPQPLLQQVPQYNNAQQLPYNPYQLQPQRQPEPAPVQIPGGQELVPLEEVGRKEEAHAFLQLPAHFHDQPGPGPTQAPHTTIPGPQPQQQQQLSQYVQSPFIQQQQSQLIPGGPSGSDFYQVKSHSYTMSPQQAYNYQQAQAQAQGQVQSVQQPSFVQQPSQQFQIQPQQFESVPAFSEDQPSYQHQHHYAGTTFHHHTHTLPQGSSPLQQVVKQHSKKHPKIHYPKPVVTSMSKPPKRLRNKNQHGMIANMEYHPEIMLPADEASFAAHQAKVLGGPAFRDEGYRDMEQQGRAHAHAQQAVGLPQLSMPQLNINPTAAAESFGFALKPLLRLGKLSANAFKQGFETKMQRLHEQANRRNVNGNVGNTNANAHSQSQVQLIPSINSRSDEQERQEIAAEASALSPTIAIALPTSRRKHNRNGNKVTSIVEHLEQAFSPRAGDLDGEEPTAASSAAEMPTAAAIRAHKKARKSAAYRERQAVLADLLKATAEADGIELVPASPPAPSS